jgi:hypothetical protein
MFTIRVHSSTITIPSTAAVAAAATTTTTTTTTTIIDQHTPKWDFALPVTLYFYIRTVRNNAYD